MVRNVQRLRKEAKANKSARLAVRSSSPGDIAIVETHLDRDEFGELKRRAAGLNVAPGWLCAAAWIKAIHVWNRSRDASTSSLISLEVPVSLRRKQDISIGNHISPLTLSGDANQSLEHLAVELKRQITRAIRQRLHLALPALSAPAKFLPWQLLRRTTGSPKFTGFATSHFTWLAQSQSIHDEVFRGSGGALQLVNQQMYAPVCLHMGAALAALAWPERVQLFLIHRLTALSATDARSLSDLLVQELGQKQLSRQQIAV